MNKPANIRSAWIVAVLCSAVHVFLALQYFDHPLEYDEAYHLLAGQSWNEDGSFRILDGEYVRAALWTRITGITMLGCGPSELCARLPSLIFSAIWIGLIAFFGSRWFGAPAGIIAGLLSGITPPIIVAAHTARFYSLHGLLIFIAAILIFGILRRKGSTRQLITMSLGAVASLAIAYHLQITTIVAIASLSAAVGVLLLPDIWRWFIRLDLRWRLLSIMLLGGVGIVAWVILDLGRYLDQWQSGPVWSRGLASNLLYYHHNLKEWLPLLWAAAPAFLLLPATQQPARTIYLVSAFAVAFVIFSTAFAKGGRYLMFALPFLYLPLGHGIGIALRGLYESVTKAARGSLMRWARPLGMAAVTAVMLFAALLQPLVPATLRMVFDPGYQRWFGYYERYPDWVSLGPWLQEQIADQPFVMTTAGVKMALVAGRYDMELYYSLMFETETGDEFGRDRRTGRPVISSAQSLQRVFDEHSQGMFIAERHYIDSDLTIPPATRELLLERTREIDTPDTKLVVRVW